MVKVKCTSCGRNNAVENVNVKVYQCLSCDCILITRIDLEEQKDEQIINEIKKYYPYTNKSVTSI